MWVLELSPLCTACAHPLELSPSSSRHNLWSCHSNAHRAAKLVPQIPRLNSRNGRGGKRRRVLCSGGTAWDGPHEAAAVVPPCFQHPAEANLQPQMEAPVDLNAVSFRLAVDELERLYDISLIAPRAFRRVARQRSSAAAAASPSSSAAAAAPPPLPPRRPPQTPSKLSGLGQPPPVESAAANTSQNLAAGNAAASASTAEACDASTATVAAAVAPAARASSPASGSSGFLAWWGPTSSSRDPDLATDTDIATAASPHINSEQPSAPQTQPQAPTLTAAAAPFASRPLGPPSSGRGVATLRGVDPRDFPALPPDRLATLLRDCAARLVPLRLSVLQSYADQVSYRALDLTADEIVSALGGLSGYGFQPAAAPWPPAASARDPSSGGGGGVRPSTPRRSPSPSPWADRILMSLLNPRPNNHSDAAASEARVTTTAPFPASSSSPPSSSLSRSTPVAAATAAAHTGEGRPHGSYRGRGAGLSRTPVASLEPHRAVELANLLVQLKVRPPPGWTADFLRNSSHLVPWMAGGDLMRLLGLLPELNAVPEAAWWNVVLDAWAPAGPPRWKPPMPAAAEYGTVRTRTTPDAASPGFPSGYGSPRERSSGGKAGAAAGDCINGRRSHSGVTIDASSAELSAPPPSGTRLSASDVRSAVLYGILMLGLPQGPGAAALASRLGGWAQAALYDIAREVLVSGQLARGAGGAYPVGGAGGDIPGSPPPPPPPSAAAISQALAALPVVVPGASSWASDLSGCGRGVLAVLVTSLEPRLKELPARLLLDLLRGLSSARLHPGPRFLLLHAMVLKGRAEELPPRQLLQAARYYTKLGLAPRGGLRAAMLRAREVLRREALKAGGGRTTPTGRRLQRTTRSTISRNGSSWR